MQVCITKVTVSVSRRYQSFKGYLNWCYMNGPFCMNIFISGLPYTFISFSPSSPSFIPFFLFHSSYSCSTQKPWYIMHCKQQFCPGPTTYCHLLCSFAAVSLLPHFLSSGGFREFQPMALQHANYLLESRHCFDV